MLPLMYACSFPGGLQKLLTLLYLIIYIKKKRRLSPYATQVWNYLLTSMMSLRYA